MKRTVAVTMVSLVSAMAACGVFSGTGTTDAPTDGGIDSSANIADGTPADVGSDVVTADASDASVCPSIATENFDEALAASPLPKGWSATTTDGGGNATVVITHTKSVSPSASLYTAFSFPGGDGGVDDGQSSAFLTSATSVNSAAEIQLSYWVYIDQLTGTPEGNVTTQLGCTLAIDYLSNPEVSVQLIYDPGAGGVTSIAALEGTVVDDHADAIASPPTSGNWYLVSMVMLGADKAKLTVDYSVQPMGGAAMTGSLNATLTAGAANATRVGVKCGIVAATPIDPLFYGTVETWVDSVALAVCP